MSRPQEEGNGRQCASDGDSPQKQGKVTLLAADPRGHRDVGNSTPLSLGASCRITWFPGNHTRERSANYCYYRDLREGQPVQGTARFHTHPGRDDRLTSPCCLSSYVLYNKSDACSLRKCPAGDLTQWVLARVSHEPRGPQRKQDSRLALLPTQPSSDGCPGSYSQGSQSSPLLLRKGAK